MNTLPPAPALAPSFVYAATVVDVHDGDTVRLRVDLGFSVFTVVDIRLAGVFAPELNQANGQAARLQLMAAIGGECVVSTAINRAGNPTRSFTRYVGRIWNKHGVDVCAAMAEWLKDLG